MKELGVTSRAILFHLYRRRNDDELGEVGNLAELLETSKANISQLARALAQGSLLKRIPYQPLLLTPNGLLLAEQIYSRVLVLESFLFKTLAAPFHRCRREALGWERSAAAETLDDIAARFDIRVGFVGDPIPSLKEQSDFVELGSLTPGEIFIPSWFDRLDFIDPVFRPLLSEIYLETCVLVSFRPSSDVYELALGDRKLLLPKSAAGDFIRVRRV